MAQSIMQQQQQLRVVKIDVIAPYNSEEERWNMARKLALVCHYLNNRCRTGCHFFNAGVTDKSYVDPEDGSFDEDDETVYMRINDGHLLSGSEDDKNTFGLLSGLMDDNEIRNCAHNYVSMIRTKSPGMGFLNIAQ